MRRKRKLPQLKELRSVQLVLDLPQFPIRSGTRVLDISTGKTGRYDCVFCNRHYINFPGKKKAVPRHLLVEIQ